MNKNNVLRGLLVLAGLSLSSLALAHGDVTPRQWTPRDSSRWARNGATPTPTASPTPSTTSPSRSAPPPTTRTARAATAWKPSPAASPRTCACWRPAPRATNGSRAGHQRRGARWRGVHAEDGRLHQPGRPLGDPQLSGKRARRRVTRPTLRRRPRRPARVRRATAERPPGELRHDLRSARNPGAVVTFKPRYGNYIGGEFVPPVKGQYFTNTSPVNGQPIAEFPVPPPRTSTRPSTPPTPPPTPGAAPRCRSARTSC